MTPASSAAFAQAAAPRIAIVGSGFAGIGMAVRLLKMGITSFMLYEAAADIGGTWRDNTYPGAGCDVPSHLYSFSFEPNPAWSREFSGQAEILAYLKHCARKYGVDRYVRCNARVVAARFDEARHVWHIELDVDGMRENVEADVLIGASGGLSRPSMPQIAGLESFKGKLFHSARWDHAYPLEGKRVAVIGTGASAIQFVPEIQPRVAQLDLFQRTAPWIMPKPNKRISERARWLFEHVPFTQRVVRSAIYWKLESQAIAFVRHPQLMKRPMKLCLSYLARRVKDPELRAKLTPNYRLGCKRVLLSSNYYRALVEPNVNVITADIREVVADGIVTQDGAHHAADAIICGTGFQFNGFGAPFEVTGIGGADLRALWLRDGPEAYLGTSIADFPNFFMIAGPNTFLGHNSMIYMIESQVQYIGDCLRVLRERNVRAMDLRRDVQREYNARLQKNMQRSVWSSGCHSWYQTGSGKVTALWPGFTFSFRKRTRRVRPRDYRFLP
ncbi:flavin-containing monooxygenase [Paraburkholderia caledonica]|uniref:Cation diffusion facilitator CzcD-associated flavoprotein CzcO n=1 Tax=Paraburkholderia caledonica TaxID=134536 RepID=A0ABU1KR41_9BURK|nr:NAD(P)/FAD-dependent oxidoreductase [Paraburkholderia caledonica]MDR6373427.1 cation diffusion facilitator CzcD-associated flavoprotein CzcO [Paraburkholderia caledonica]